MLLGNGLLHIGVDFGTTNTVVALSDDAGNVRTLQFPSAGGLQSAFRSILCYVAEDADGFNPQTTVYCGPAAIEAFFRHGEQARLIQSVKTFLSSKSFSKSTIHGRDYTLEEILADFLRGLWNAGAAGEWLPANAPITVGRPVKFAGGGDEALAEKRLRSGFAALSKGRIDFALEPQAAAYFFVRRLKAPATVLVADFGGGTSDFSVVRFDPRTGATQALGHAGVGIAGDTLDFRIIDHVIAPLFGKGSHFRPADKMLEVPKWIYFEFEHWHRLSFLKRPAVLRELQQIELSSDSPQTIARLRLFLEQELGFHLYQAVNRCKAELSVADSAALTFKHPPIDIACTVQRADFEQWIARDVAAIEAACSEALADARVTGADISVVFMTGGTSFVPAIRRRFEARFGVEKIVAGDEFVSVGSGLALLARERALQKR
ncbi:MAG: Hsp70 family protein [Betaproteobacteria bacterium]|nr:Hsp70 family protein [Betaproteobacteria bacterium]